MKEKTRQIDEQKTCPETILIDRRIEHETRTQMTRWGVAATSDRAQKTMNTTRTWFLFNEELCCW